MIKFGVKSVVPSKRKTRLTKEEREQRYLDDKKLIDDLESQTTPKDGKVTLKYPIGITSVHNRRPAILDHLDQFGDSKIYIFHYENEDELYEYLNKDKRIVNVSVPMDYLKVQKMRLFIQNYFRENKVSKYWVADDDLVDIFLYEKSRKVSAAQGFRMLEIFSEGKEWSAIGYGHVDMGCKFWHGGMTADNYASVALLFNGDVCDKYNLKYTGDVNVNEDIEFVINSHIAGVPVKCCNWGLLNCYEPSGGKNSQASRPEQHLHYQDSLYIKYGDLVRLRLENRRGYTAGIRYGRFDKPRTYDERLLELCKAGDHEATKKYLESVRNKNAEENY